jgi:lysophospholipase L1-like esterase
LIDETEFRLFLGKFPDMKRILALALCCALTAASHRPLTWVAIGDSITYLNDHTDETGHRLTKGYLTDVVDRLPYVHYVNQGHNGWTTTDFARSIDKLGIPVGDVYTIFLGTNDWWQGHRIGTWADYEQATGDSTIYGCFRIIVNKLHQLNPSAPIILLTPMPRADFVYINGARNNAYGSYRDKNGQSLEAVAAAVADIGQHEGFRVIDLYHERGLSIPHLVRFKRLRDPATGAYRNYTYPDYVSIPFDPADEYPYPPEAQDMTYDGLHPSDKGDALIAKRVVRAIKGL